ncbi:MAG TPA: DUF4402 domain-containing protein [Panacibacter sp.]|nr:DUF4402 domain-containing protein [Panacibacter sp.]HNP42662.1 DUF4402 domain-containing protein [Panacibacter sp.]
MASNYIRTGMQKKGSIYVFGMVLGLLFFSTRLRAQEHPPRPISVYVNPAQGLIFGAFFQGITGGSVILYPDGSRSSTGDLVLANLGMPFSPAIFEVDANPGALISILNGPDVTLTGSNGGTLRLHIGTSSTGTPFIATAVPPNRTEVRIGGILSAGNALANPSGVYSGYFAVTFIQE